MNDKNTPFQDWWMPHQIELVKDLTRKWELKTFISTAGVWLPASEGKILSKQIEQEPLPYGAKLDPKAWDHEHCELCFETISDQGSFQREGYTDGKDWVCQKCYETYILLYRKINR